MTDAFLSADPLYTRARQTSVRLAPLHVPRPSFLTSILWFGVKAAFVASVFGLPCAIAWGLFR